MSAAAAAAAAGNRPHISHSWPIRELLNAQPSGFSPPGIHFAAPFFSPGSYPKKVHYFSDSFRVLHSSVTRGPYQIFISQSNQDTVCRNKLIPSNVFCGSMLFRVRTLHRLLSCGLWENYFKGRVAFLTAVLHVNTGKKNTAPSYCLADVQY